MKIGPGDVEKGIVNLVIEIQRGKGRNKYEFDKDSGMIVLDRVNATMLGYPADYGFVPQTLCEDGDPIDGLLVIDESVLPGIVVPSRVVGVLNMIDDGERDEKLICVPADDISKKHIQDVDDLGSEFKKIVEHFYSHYKDWKNEWQGSPVSFDGWGGKDEALRVLVEAAKAVK